ncbi:MAG: hypothetical protein JKY88_14275 [Pseudomonadales bacterium]|nr:hypothetical protein [Pseudomonadales bacterium]
MENLIAIGAALITGLVIGIVLGKSLSKGRAPSSVDTKSARPEWWQKRDALTGTQMQILQYIESKREANIVALQEKFSFIPDRELYYRLEQIVLMGFMARTRVEGDVIFVLDETYVSTVESDKTVMLSGD